MRIVSLVPSATETLVAWGVEPVACTRYCEQPGLANVGGTKDPDVGAIVALGPDLVVLDEEENRHADHAALVAAGVPVHVLAIRSVADVGEQLGGLAAALDVVWTPPPVPTEPPVARRAWIPIWKRPWMALGHDTYGASMLRALGVGNVAALDDGRYPELEPDEARRRGAALVVAPDEPYRFGERHRAELERVAPAIFVDGRDLLWWGSRTEAALTRLAAVLDV